MWILKAVSEGEIDRTFRILPGGVRTIGRAAGADFILNAPLVSRVHCRLTATADGGLEVRDLDSTNGTFVNNVKVKASRARARRSRSRGGSRRPFSRGDELSKGLDWGVQQGCGVARDATCVDAATGGVAVDPTKNGNQLTFLQPPPGHASAFSFSLSRCRRSCSALGRPRTNACGA